MRWFYGIEFVRLPGVTGLVSFTEWLPFGCQFGCPGWPPFRGSHDAIRRVPPMAPWSLAMARCLISRVACPDKTRNGRGGTGMAEDLADRDDVDVHGVEHGGDRVPEVVEGHLRQSGLPEGRPEVVLEEAGALP